MAIKSRLLIIGVAILIIGIVLLALYYPISNNKDFLDILSSLGSAVSALGILLVTYELLLKEKELELEAHPDIEIGRPEIVTISDEELPSGIIRCLSETDPTQLPPKEDLFETFDDYHTIWHMINTPDETEESNYAVIDITNHQENIKGGARNFAVKLSITYYRNSAIKQGYPVYVWVPAKGCNIYPKQTKLFYVRCGPVHNSDYSHVGLKILKYRCNNHDGDFFEVEREKTDSIREPLSS